jgi:hypothetical protein
MNVARMYDRKGLLVAGLLAFTLGVPALRAQETVFNVPSADVLDAGKTYLEWDATIGDSAPSAAITPRTVYGAGHGIETGINVSSFNLPDASSVIFTPTIKWKFYQQKSLGLDFFGGEHLFLPLTRRSYNIGSFTYLASAKTFKSGTRIAAGAYDFSARVVDRANRGGIFASIEQPINARLSAATDWFIGNTGVGYVTPGVSVKVTGAVTVMTGFQMGNSGCAQGNHSLLVVFGWNPQWSHTTL